MPRELCFLCRAPLEDLPGPFQFRRCVCKSCGAEWTAESWESLIPAALPESRSKTESIRQQLQREGSACERELSQECRRKFVREPQPDLPSMCEAYVDAWLPPVAGAFKKFLQTALQVSKSLEFHPVEWAHAQTRLAVEGFIQPKLWMLRVTGLRPDTALSREDLATLEKNFNLLAAGCLTALQVAVKNMATDAYAELPINLRDEPAASGRRTSRKGRQKDKMVQHRREVIARIAATGVSGERYVRAIDARGLSTPIKWQLNEKCPKAYPDAYNHPDPEQREKWRKRISNEKTKAVAAHAERRS